MPAEGGLQADRCRASTRAYKSHPSGKDPGAAIPSNTGRLPMIMEDVPAEAEHFEHVG